MVHVDFVVVQQPSKGCLSVVQSHSLLIFESPRSHYEHGPVHPIRRRTMQLGTPLACLAQAEQRVQLALSESAEILIHPTVRKE